MRSFLKVATKMLGLVLMLAAMSTVAMAVSEDHFTTPEIDPASASSAVALLSAGVMLLKDRGRRNG